MTNLSAASGSDAETRRRTLSTAAQKQQSGEWEAAAALCSTLLLTAPDDVDALHLLGIVRARQGMLIEAMGLIEKALQHAPQHAAALSNLALMQSQAGRREEAGANFARALVLQPDSAEIRNNRGHALLGSGATGEALAEFDRAIALQPGYAEAHNNRGIALVYLKRPEEALPSLCRALELRPGYVGARNNRANTLKELGRLDEAVCDYSLAIAADRGFADAYNNRGLTLLELGRLQEAQGDFACAIAIRPDYAEALHNRGAVALLTGDYAIGWRDYEHRWRIPGFARRGRTVTALEWHGQELTNKTILVHEEQGLGDVIQFARFLPVLSSRGAQVTFVVRGFLHRLLQTLDAPPRLLDETPTAGAFDFQSSLMSLPGALGMTLRNLPEKIPYVSAEPPLVAKWRAWLGDGGLRIGICWQCTPSVDQGRSAPLQLFRHLATIPGVRLVSLQQVNGLDQLARLPEGMRVEIPGDDFERGRDAFCDTAAIMTQLDLIITTDTSIAHLAGALGRPVWVALKQMANWRWLLDREDSPWYPTARLYRQRRRGEWGEVFQRMAIDVARLSPANPGH